MFNSSALITPGLVLNYACDNRRYVSVYMAHGYVVNGQVIEYDGTGAVIQQENDLTVVKVADVVAVSLTNSELT